MDFQLQETVREIKIKDKAGEVVKAFSVDVGNYEYLEKWCLHAEAATQAISDHGKQGTADSLKRAMAEIETIITAVLGEDAWLWFWEATNHNLNQAVVFSRKLSDFLTKEMAAIQKGYV